MNADGSDRPGRAPLAALLAVAVLGSLGVVLLALRDDGEGQPAAVAPGQVGPFRGNRLPEGIRNKPAPHFRLTDARGGVLDSRDLRGSPYVVTLLFTNCPDVCPIIAQELRKALDLLGRRADEVAIVAVSVDPEGDSSGVVRQWLSRHRLPENFHYLIGNEARLRPVWDSYFAAPQRDGRQTSQHTASIWLVDRKGRWRTRFSAGVPVPPRNVAHDLRVLLREDDPTPRAAASR